jgi:putative glutamine amidotransferase
VLGVCRGLQMINRYLGGRLDRLDGHVARGHEVRSGAHDLVFAAYTEVNSFHGWGIRPDSLASTLTPRVWAADGSVEAASHSLLPWIGIMWHPERSGVQSVQDTLLLQQVFNGASR